MGQTFTRLVIAALALALLPIGCRADTPSFDDATAEEILAAAEAAMAKVGSFACATETTYGSGDSWDTITIESQFRDGQNYRKSMSVHIPGVPFVGPSEFAMVRGKVYLVEPEGGITSAEVSTTPTYSLPDDVTGLERLDDETLDAMRVYHLRGDQAIRHRGSTPNSRSLPRRRNTPAGPLRDQGHCLYRRCGPDYRGTLHIHLQPLRGGFRHRSSRPNAHTQTRPHANAAITTKCSPGPDLVS